MEEHDGEALLKLTCATCDNPSCKNGFRYAPVDSLVGCTRWVPEEIFDQYIHYMYEIIPFWHLYDEKYINNSYLEIYNFINQIYKNYPIAKLLDYKGKTIGG